MLNSEFMFPITFYRLLRRRWTTFWTKLPTDHLKLPRQSPQRPKPLSPQVWPEDNFIPLISLQKMMFRFIGNCPLATFKFLSSNQGTVRLHFFSHIARPQGLWKSKCIFVSGPTCLWSIAAATETVTLTPSASAKAVAAAATKTKKIKVRPKKWIWTRVIRIWIKPQECFYLPAFLFFKRFHAFYRLHFREAGR